VRLLRIEGFGFWGEVEERKRSAYVRGRSLKAGPFDDWNRKVMAAATREDI
jgi:hypothetical protein